MEAASPISFTAAGGATVDTSGYDKNAARSQGTSTRKSMYQRNPQLSQTQRISTSSVGGGGNNGVTRSRSLPTLMRQVTETSRRSSARLLKAVGKRYRITNDTHSNNLQDMFSGLYAMCLTVLGATLPVAKVFATEISIETYEAFYIYLYVVSIAFIIFVQVFILHYNGALTWRGFRRFCRKTYRRCCKTSGSKAETTDADEEKRRPNDTELREVGDNVPDLNDNIKETDIIDTDSQSPYSSSSSSSEDDGVAYTMKQGESFYLRLGAVVFGIVFMTMTGLKLGHFIELAAHNGSDIEPILIARPIIQLIFILVQLYFIFVNSAICIHRYQTLARFGTMHLIATNLCLWLRVITIEIVRAVHQLLPHAVFGVGFHEAIGQIQYEELQPLHQGSSHLLSDGHSGHHMSSMNDSLSHHGHHRRDVSHDAHHAESPLMNVMHNITGKNVIMDSIVQHSSSYIYPCSIEYCFIAAGIHLMIWSNIGTRVYEATDDDTIVRSSSVVSRESIGAAAAAVDNARGGSLRRQNSQRSFLMTHRPVHVDWSGASRGLFAGILLFVLTIISIVLFYVFKANGEVIQCTTQIILYSITLVFVFVAAYMFRNFVFRGDRNQSDNRRLDEKLLVLTLIGVFLYRVLTIIAGHFSPAGSLVLGTSVLVIIEFAVLIIVQAAIQTVFLLNALHRVATAGQRKTKPGRNIITFLLLCNISIWCVNIFQGQSPETNYIAMSFYGPVPWTILAHISIPLAIFHQFHVTLCLSTIWKTAYKGKIKE